VHIINVTSFEIKIFLIPADGKPYTEARGKSLARLIFDDFNKFAPGQSIPNDAPVHFQGIVQIGDVTKLAVTINNIFSNHWSLMNDS
jgi:hypothetical protein